MLEPFFCRFVGYAWPCYSFLCFIPPAWVFPGDSLFPLAVGDIIITSHYFLLRLHPLQMSHPIRGFPASTHPHACILSSGGIPQGSFFIHLSERKHLLLKIHQAQLIHHLFVSYIQGKCMFTWQTAPTLLVFQHNPNLFDACTHDLSLTFILKMVDWIFENALAAINSLPSIPTSVLESADGLRLGDVCFVKIHTTLWMHAVSLALLKKLVANGGFNLECKANGDYSHSTAILLTLNPDAQLKDIESMGIRLVVHQHGSLLAPISSIAKLISYIHNMLKFKRASSSPQVRTYCMIIGNYGGYMVYATEPPFCIAYPLEFIDKMTMLKWHSVIQTTTQSRS